MIKYIFLKICKVFFKYISRIFLVIIYMIAGGALFVYLELDNEISSCKISMEKYVIAKNDAIQRMMSLSLNVNEVDGSSSQIDSQLQSFAVLVYQININPSMNCSTIGQSDNLPKWTLANSVFFCSTVMTTVGYGNITPKTKWGQVMCIIYAIFGIPIMLLFLSSVGDPMANAVRYLYSNLCCCRCFLKSQNFEKASFEKAEDDNKSFTISMPIILVLSILAVYIILGWVLFSIWEDWDIVEGTYFAFITLSTIGFGDYVPGQNGFMSSDSMIELVLGTSYSVFGMALLSMALNLIQDEITGKLTWFAIKFKCFSPSNEEESDYQLDVIQSSEIYKAMGFYEVGCPKILESSN